MVKIYNNPFFPSMKRARQLTPAHCGPAVVKMLLNFIGIFVTQEQIVDASGVRGKLPTHGMTVAEMGKAVSVLAPSFEFWSKMHSTISELSEVVNLHQYPVGVEWQGVFLRMCLSVNVVLISPGSLMCPSLKIIPKIFPI